MALRQTYSIELEKYTCTDGHLYVHAIYAFFNGKHYELLGCIDATMQALALIMLL